MACNRAAFAMSSVPRRGIVMLFVVLLTLLAAQDGAAAQPAPVVEAPARVEAPASVDAAAPAPVDAPALVDAPAVVDSPPVVAAPSRLLRVVVQDVVVPADASKRLGPLFTSGLVAEVRKLEGVTVVGMDEVRAIVAMEATRQTAGCEASGCLSELADALGADVVVTATLGALENDSVVSFRRLDTKDAKPVGFDRRFPRGDGEEFLAVIGPAVAELFPAHKLRAGEERGMDREAALRLNPPPLRPWMLAVGATASVALALTGGAFGVTSSALAESAQRRVDASVVTPSSALDVKNDFATAQTTAWVANSLFVGAGVAAVATGVGVLFTDFAGYADE